MPEGKGISLILLMKGGREDPSWNAADHLPSQEGSFNTLGSPESDAP